MYFLPFFICYFLVRSILFILQFFRFCPLILIFVLFVFLFNFQVQKQVLSLRAALYLRHYRLSQRGLVHVIAYRHLRHQPLPSSSHQRNHSRFATWLFDQRMFERIGNDEFELARLMSTNFSVPLLFFRCAVASLHEVVSVGPPVLFSKVKSTRTTTRRILCRVSGLVC